MERRKVLAAISAAIAIPADAWHQEIDRRAAEAGRGLTQEEEYDTSIGLTPMQAKCRAYVEKLVRDRLEDVLENRGPYAFVDLFLLSEALGEYWTGSGCDEFCGLMNSIERTFNSDRRFVAVPEEIHEEVAAFIEERKTALLAEVQS